MLADGLVRITDTDSIGSTALVAAAGGYETLPTLKWLLKEGESFITERDDHGFSALLEAARYNKMVTCQWLLEHGGAIITDTTNTGADVWDFLQLGHDTTDDAEEVTALLHVMVLKGDPPDTAVARLRPEHVQVVEEGARLRAALPAYLTQRWALLDAHCPLIAPLPEELQTLILSFEGPMTTEELSATGLGAAPQRARRQRVEAAIALPLCRSDRLRQRLE
jgi:hypothetical protein